MQRLLVALALPALGVAQIPRLGEPPTAPAAAPPGAAPVIPPEAASGFLDTTSRATVRDFYNNVYAPIQNTPLGWSGDILAGNAGDTSQAYKNTVAANINWFRSMAGVPAAITLNATYDQKDQLAAMMMSANGALSHNPPSSWIDYTAGGAQAAMNSNLCLGFQNDPGCTTLYIQDFGAGNGVVGHRRWILYPQTQTMGTGDVPATGNLLSANAMWVFDGNFGMTRPPTRDAFVAWPPKGYVPYQVVFPRWSFAYANADFTNATVTMQRNGSPVPVRLETPVNGYGENTLVFIPDNLDPTQFYIPAPPATETATTVTIHNALIQGVPANFTYSVTVFDPSASTGAVPITVATTPAGLNVTVDGVTAPSPQSFSWSPGSAHTLDAPSPQGGSQTRQVFSAWSNGGARFQNVTAPSAATTYTASFTTQYLLTLSVWPPGVGTLTANPASADGFYNAGSVVQLTAAANPGYLFTGFSGGLSGTTNPALLTINGPTAVTANFAAASRAGSRLVPITPCRIVDTRGLTAPIMGSNSSRTFPVAAGLCGVPASAVAYSVNVTVVPASVLQYLTIWPTGQAKPLVSTLNSYDGRVVANAAIVPAGTNGSVDVFVTDQTHVIIDVNGYFDPQNPAALPFFSATPCRIADTRSGFGFAGAFGPPRIAGGTQRDFPIPTGGCGLPASAGAYSLNITAVPPGPLGYLTTWPTGQTRPTVSTLNSYDGSVVANAALVPAGTGGSISVFVPDPTDLILDGNGYFASTGSGTALSFYPVTPCRVADTRLPAGGFGGPTISGNTSRSFAIPQSVCGIPPAAQAYSLNVTVVPKGPLTYLTLWPAGQTQPGVSTLNSFTGRVVANAAIVPAGTNGSVSVFVSDGTDVILDINGYFAP